VVYIMVRFLMILLYFQFLLSIRGQAGRTAPMLGRPAAPALASSHMLQSSSMTTTSALSSALSMGCWAQVSLQLLHSWLVLSSCVPLVMLPSSARMEHPSAWTLATLLLTKACAVTQPTWFKLFEV
jgi:hypothetical protein